MLLPRWQPPGDDVVVAVVVVAAAAAAVVGAGRHWSNVKTEKKKENQHVNPIRRRTYLLLFMYKVRESDSARTL